MDVNEAQERFNLRSFEPKTEYSTDEDFIINDFYSPCLKLSTKYDRAVGYFRANIYRELGVDLLNFAKRGGKIRLICSPDIPKNDEEAAREGYDLRGKRTQIEQEISLIHILQEMAKYPKERDCLDMLRLLIEKNSMELYIATRPGGIYHRKIGVFYDTNNNYISFSGSGNETQRAISEIEDWANDEEFDVYRSWGNEFERHKALVKVKYFEKLLNSKTKTKVRPLNTIEREEIMKFRSHQNFDACLPGAQERSLRKLIVKEPISTYGKFEAFINGRKVKPYYFQQNAIEHWELKNNIGMLSMATGTGKTITALFAISRFIREGRLIVIIVPSKILIDQWKSNITDFFPSVPILIAGGGYDWKINTMKRIFVQKIEQPRIILTTMATASSPDFISFLNQAIDAVLVVDEAHRIGSPQYRNILKNLNFKEKLGLSATPERLFDDEGNKVITDTFGTEPVYLLPIWGKVKLSKDDEEEIPILGNFLSKYYYYFEKINLTANEQKEWDEITQEAKQFIGRHPDALKETGSEKDKQRLDLYYIQRSRILKKAQGKIQIASKVIMEKYNDQSRWIVYCEDEEQMNAVASTIRLQNKNLTVLNYHSKMNENERDRTLEFFERNPSVIVSIRCLDEGVDIPIVNGALILASSTNPRQYIQRRGRVLRKAKTKGIAIIIDALVLPEMKDNDDYQPIIKSELSRAWNFAQHAENSEITHELWELGIKYGADLNNDGSLSFNEVSTEEENGI